MAMDGEELNNLECASVTAANTAQTGEGGRDRCMNLSKSLHWTLFQSFDRASAMENFFSFDLNWDGLVSLEKVAESCGNNGTEEGFKQVDTDRDGFVEPSESDFSLN